MKKWTPRRPLRELSRKEQTALVEFQKTLKRVKEGRQPIPNESEVERQERISRLLKPEQFYEFCLYYFPDLTSSPFAWFHKAAIEAIIVQREPNIILEWPREHAKSVLVTILIPAYLYFTGYLQGFLLAGETDEKACQLLSALAAHLIANPRIIADFGHQGVTGSAHAGHFTTHQGIGFWAVGAGQNPSGTREGHRRPNYGVIDDADSKALAKNQQRTLERLDWVLGEFAGCLDTRSSIMVFANNRVHRQGLTAHLVGDLEEDNPRRPGFMHIKSFMTEDPKTRAMKLIEQGGQPSWPERYTLEQCQAKMYRMGYRNGLRQLYHMHIEEGSRFKDELLAWADPLPLHLYDDLVTYLDPAYGSSDKGCFRALVLVGLTRGHYHILYAWVRQTGSFTQAHYQLATAIAEAPESITGISAKTIMPGTGLAVRQKVNCRHYVESNELQKIILKQLYAEANAMRDGLPWFPSFDMAKKSDKIGRIEALEPLVEQRAILFNKLHKSSPDMRTLRDQFLAFPNGFVDGPDAVEGAISKMRRKSISGNTGWQGIAGGYNSSRSN